MSSDLEYAIKKDIHNNPVVREADVRQARELRRVVLITMLVVGVLLFAVWQHLQVLAANTRIEKLRSERATEEIDNRQLHVELEMLRAPSRIERRAKALGLREATMDDSVVVERVPSPAPAGAVVAEAR